MNYREVIPLKQGLDFKLTLPGSKSITNRALLCAALAKDKSRLFGMLESDDTKVMSESLKKVGVKIKKIKDYVEVIGVGGRFKSGNFNFDLHNAGTATRFLTAIMAMREGETVITGDRRMCERPIGDLVDGLRQIGIDIAYLGDNGFPPLKIRRTEKTNENHDLRNTIHNSQYLLKMSGDKSSQYFSALLMLGPLLNRPLKIEVVGDLVSKPYIDITISVLRAFGINVKNDNYKSFIIKPQIYKATDYRIEGDASAASYWTSIAYLHDGKVKFNNLTSRSIQGDIQYEQVLDELKKCQKSKLKSKKLKVDMNEMPDVAMTLACTAPFFKCQTKITGLSTLRIKETDRLTALERELNKISVHSSTTVGMTNRMVGMTNRMVGMTNRMVGMTNTTKDSITISPITGATMEPQWSHNGAAISTYNDHRMAMCFSVIGTKIPGIVIKNPGCTDKTYPNFWKDLERMYISKKVKLGQKNLILTGMRCSGKSYLGKRIANVLGRKFVDLDIEIEKAQKMKIPEIVKQYGWEYFRKVEQKICSLYSEPRSLIIATGGGVILDSGNMKNLMQNGINVFIFADPAVLIKRITNKSGTRPSLTGKKSVVEISDTWKDRRDLYLKYADYTWDNTSGEIISGVLSVIFD